MSWVKKDGIENSSALYQEWVNFAIGKHKANLVLAYGTDNKLVTANATFYVWPWRIMLITILALVAIVFILTFGKRSWEKGVIKKYEKRQARRR
jgi:amino acid permease